VLNLKGALDASADLLRRLTTNWRAGCEKFACPVRREGRSLSFVLPLSLATRRCSLEDLPWPRL
jgi:hypothetical protein